MNPYTRSSSGKMIVAMVTAMVLASFWWVRPLTGLAEPSDRLPYEAPALQSSDDPPMVTQGPGGEDVVLRASGPPPLPPLEGQWQITCVDCPTPVIGIITDRTLRIDSRDRLHVAFGGDHLMYGFSDGGPWTFTVAD